MPDRNMRTRSGMQDRTPSATDFTAASSTQKTLSSRESVFGFFWRKGLLLRLFLALLGVLDDLGVGACGHFLIAEELHGVMLLRSVA